MSIFSGLKAYWRFDESAWAGVAGEVVDNGGLNSNGVAVNGASISASGKIGRCGNFVAASLQYINVGDIASLDMGTSDFSVSFWVKTSNTGTMHIVSKRALGAVGAAKGYRVSLAAGRIYILFDDATVNAVSNYLSTGTVNNGSWRHVVVTFDRDANALAYIDGVVSGSGLNISAVGDIDTTEPLYIGKYSTVYYNGQLDEMAIWKRVLSQAEITDLYGGGNGRALNHTSKKMKLNHWEKRR